EETELNEYHAMLLQAELMGETEKVEEIKKKIEELSKSGASSKEEVEVVSGLDEKGRMIHMPFAPRDAEEDRFQGGGRRKRRKVNRYDERGERVRYYDDDDDEAKQDL